MDRENILDRIIGKNSADYSAMPCNKAITVVGAGAAELEQYCKDNAERPLPNLNFNESDGYKVSLVYDETGAEWRMGFDVTGPAIGQRKQVVLYFQGEQEKTSILWILYALSYGHGLDSAIAELNGSYISFVCLPYGQQAVTAQILSNINYYLSGHDNTDDALSKFKEKLYGELLEKIKPFIATAPSFSNRPIRAENYNAMFSRMGFKNVYKNADRQKLAEKLYGTETVGAELADYIGFVKKSQAYSRSMDEAAKILRSRLGTVRYYWLEEILEPTENREKISLEQRPDRINFKLSAEKLKEVFSEIDRYYEKTVKAKLEEEFLTALLSREKESILQEARDARQAMVRLHSSLQRFCLLEAKELKQASVTWRKLVNPKPDFVSGAFWSADEIEAILLKLNAGNTWYNEEYGSRAFVLCSEKLAWEPDKEATGTMNFPVLYGPSCIWIAFGKAKAGLNGGGENRE